MCVSTPEAPKPVAARQAPKLPDTADVKARSDDALRRRAQLSGMTFSSPDLAPPATAGKATLGA